MVGSSTVHTTTRMPSSWARPITRSEWIGSRPSLIGTCAKTPVPGRTPRGRTPPREQAISVVSERQPRAVVTPGASSWRRRSQRLQAPDVVRPEAQPVTDPLAQLVLGHEQVPEHPLLDGAVALGEPVDEVGDELVALPGFAEQVALPSLGVVVGPRDPELDHDVLLARPKLDEVCCHAVDREPDVVLVVLESRAGFDLLRRRVLMAA